MPIYAYVEANLECPTCGTSVMPPNSENLVDFQWGYCPGRFPQTPYIYHVGNPIHWRTCPDGSIPVWTFFMKDGYLDGGNVGDPEVRNLIVRDHNPGYSFIRVCENCGERFTGAAVEIRDSVIKRVWLCIPGETVDARYNIEGGTLLLPGELDISTHDAFIEAERIRRMTNSEYKLSDLDWQVFHRPDVYLIESNDSLKPMPEWNDHPMPTHLNLDCAEVDPFAKRPPPSS